jgi:hypothetical protein
MAVTGQNVIDRINSYANDAVHGTWSAAQKLEAVNVAIDAAFGLGVKNIKTDTSITLASTTREYTPTATDVTPEDGFGLAFVTPDSTTTEIKVRLHRVYQRMNNGTWTIVIPYDITSAFNGNTLNLLYNARYARLAAATDSVDLPLDYLFNYAMWWLSGSGLISKINNDRKVSQQQMDFFYQHATLAARGYIRGLTTKLQIAYDTPAPQGGGRYGQFIVSNP